jgi:hypothetical protein
MRASPLNLFEQPAIQSFQHAARAIAHVRAGLAIILFEIVHN